MQETPNIPKQFVLKFRYKKVCKRVKTIPKNTGELVSIISETFPDLHSTSILVYYVDSDGDKITIGNETDLQEAYRQAAESKQQFLKILVVTEEAGSQKRSGKKKELTESDQSDSSNSIEPSNSTGTKKKLEKKIIAKYLKELNKKDPLEDITKKLDSTQIEEKKDNSEKSISDPSLFPLADKKIHLGTECSSCHLRPIVGIRYQCSVCAGYSLCEKCEVKGVHKEHLFLKISDPSLDYFASKTLPHPFYPPKPIIGRTHMKFGSGETIPPKPAKTIPGEEEKQPCAAQPIFHPFSFGGHSRHRDSEIPRKKRKMVHVLDEQPHLKLQSLPGNIVMANWLIENRSKSSWPSTLIAIKESGNIDFEPIPFNNKLAQGEIFELALPVWAPAATGEYSLKVRFKNEFGVFVGEPLKISLTVADAVSENKMEVETVPAEKKEPEKKEPEEKALQAMVDQPKEETAKKEDTTDKNPQITNPPK